MNALRLCGKSINAPKFIDFGRCLSLKSGDVALNFHDTANCFGSKSRNDLLRSLFVLKLCSSKTLVKHHPKVGKSQYLIQISDYFLIMLAAKYFEKSAGKEGVRKVDAINILWTICCWRG